MKHRQSQENNYVCGTMVMRPKQAKVREYAAASMNLSTKNEIFSAMVVYGFLSYENGKVRIPNKELMECLEDQLETKQHRCQVEEIK